MTLSDSVLFVILINDFGYKDYNCSISDINSYFQISDLNDGVLYFQLVLFDVKYFACIQNLLNLNVFAIR